MHRKALEYYNQLDQAAYFRREEVIKAYGSDYEDVIEYFRKEAIQKLKAYYKMSREAEPAVLPVTDAIHYAYDYGDGWTFTITCLDIFTEGEEYDRVWENGGPVCIAKDGGMLIDDVGGIGGYIDFLRKTDKDYFRKTHPRASSPEDGYEDEFADDYEDEGEDGLYSDPTYDPEYLLTWAKGQGWTGREISLDKML